LPLAQVKHHHKHHHKRRGRGLLSSLASGVKTGLSLSKQMGVGDKLASSSNPNYAMAGKLLKMAGGRHHYRGRGLLSSLASGVKTGLSMSNSMGVGNKLAASSDPRVAMAGKLLKMAGGGRKRRHHHRR